MFLHQFKMGVGESVVGGVFWGVGGGIGVRFLAGGRWKVSALA